MAITRITNKQRSFIVQKKIKGFVFLFDGEQEVYDDVELTLQIKGQIEELMDIVPRVLTTN